MKTNLVNFVGYIGISIVLSFIFAVGFLVFKSSFGDIGNTVGFISAFAGAFFAYVFVKFGELGTRLYTRQRINQEAIVMQEQVLQEYVNKLYGNEFVIDDIIKTIVAAIAAPDEPAKVNFNFLKPLLINTSSITPLLNIDYKNDALNFYADIDKLNGSMLSIQRYYDLLTEHLMTDQLPRTVYLENLKIIQIKMIELKKFIKASIDDSVEMAAKTRLLLKETPILFVSAIRLKPQLYSKKLLFKIDGEKSKLQQEMLDNSKSSSIRIKKIIKS